jgi:putative oxidoreductase
MSLLASAQARVLTAATAVQPVALLLVRVVVGLVFVFSGWGKLHGLDHVVDYFRELGIPYPELQAPFVASVELGGGALVLLGLGTRLAVLPLTGTMLVAILTAKLKTIEGPSDVFFFSETDYLVFFFALFAFGAGRFSLDALLARLRAPRVSSVAQLAAT